MAGRHDPRPIGFLTRVEYSSPRTPVRKCSCGDGRIRPSRRAKRGDPSQDSYQGMPSGMRQQAQQQEGASAPEANTTIENRSSTRYKSHYGPSARQPHPRPHPPASRPHHNRRGPAPGRSSRSSPLHQPPSVSKSRSDGGSSRHRSSRPATPTPPPSRPPPPSQLRRPILNRASSHTCNPPPKCRRRNLRHSSRFRRPTPPQPSRNAHRRPGRRDLLRHQRRNSPEIPPPTPPLKQMSK
jgi:hypothetical protein